MPDFDTRRPQESNEPSRLRIQLIANKIRTLLMAYKPRILSIASSLRSMSTANRLRTMLISGGVLLFVVGTVPMVLLLYPFSGSDGMHRIPLNEAPTGKIAFEKI